VDWQPIFYPVVTEEYAAFIAREWNTRDSSNGLVGYVPRFHVGDAYLATYSPQLGGGLDFQECWIPAADLSEFNTHIVGSIDVIAEFR
jgi:hypothetical protein